jgi:kinesin family protein 18/19
MGGPSYSNSHSHGHTKTSAPTGNAGGGAHHPCMKVVVRLRPANEKERSTRAHRVVLKPMDDHMVLFDPLEATAIAAGAAGNSSANGAPSMTSHNNSRRARDQRFMFDKVFDEHSTQAEVFAGSAREVLDSVVEGYNATVFAYGATSSGKTHTMIGEREIGMEGIMVQSLRYLFDRLARSEPDTSSELFVSYLEVYNETLRDLLVEHSAPLQILEGKNGSISVPGLSQHQPHTAEEVFDLISLANTRRTVSPTDANAVSSRSHAVLTVTVHRRLRQGVRESVSIGKVALIDLAGSERAAMTSNRGERLREGANINQSLLALGNCINALSQRKAKSFIPYRRSKLTRLLKDALGGNCRTVMIATLSPSSLVVEDSLNTLKYASQATTIQMQARKTVLNVERHIIEYRKIVADLRAEIEEMRQRDRAAAGAGEAGAAAEASGDKEDSIWSSRINEVCLERAQLLEELRAAEHRLSELRSELAWIDFEETWADAEMRRSAAAATSDPRRGLIFAQVDCEQLIATLRERLEHSRRREAQLETYVLTHEGFSSWYRQACIQKLRAELRQTEREDADMHRRSAEEREALLEQQVKVLVENARKAASKLETTGGNMDAEIRRGVTAACRTLWRPRDEDLLSAHADLHTPSRRRLGPRRTPRSKARSTPLAAAAAAAASRQACGSPADAPERLDFSSAMVIQPAVQQSQPQPQPLPQPQPVVRKPAGGNAARSGRRPAPGPQHHGSPKCAPHTNATAPLAANKPSSPTGGTEAEPPAARRAAARRPIVFAATSSTTSDATGAAATAESARSASAVVEPAIAGPVAQENADAVYEERMKNVRAFLARSISKGAEETPASSSGRTTRSGRRFANVNE